MTEQMSVEPQLVPTPPEAEKNPETVQAPEEASALLQYFRENYQNDKIYHDQHVSGLGPGDCYNNTLRALKDLSKKRLLTENTKVLVFWYQFTYGDQPHTLNVATNALRPEELVGEEADVMRWDEHIVPVEMSGDLQDAKVFDLSATPEHLGQSLEGYLQDLLAPELTSNRLKAEKKITLLLVPAEEFRKNKKPDRYTLMAKLGSHTLGEVLGNETKST